MSLLNDLRGAGLHVQAQPDWETNTNRDRDRLETVGIINHWDANPGEPGTDHYLWDNRFGGILYHILIRRGGLVELLSQRYVWHAGKGDSAVLEALRRGERPPPPTDRYSDDGQHLTPVNSGNPYTWGVAINYHPDEGPVPAAQYEALVAVNRVLATRSNLTTSQVIDHRHWTTRKRDIDTIDLARLRADIDRKEPTVTWTKHLNETQWRALYKAGIAKSSSEEALIDYWVTRAAERSNEEWLNAAAAMFVEATTRGFLTMDAADARYARQHDHPYVKAGKPVILRNA